MHLLYKVENCSSQNPNQPASNLTTRHNHWQSERFCEYPILLTITFYQPALIKSIKIGAHPSKVPTRINILSYLPDIEDKGFEKLGFVSFLEPDPTNVLSQVKCINNIEVKARQLRFILLKNHQTTNNFFNQVGLSLLEVRGEPILHFIPQKMSKSQVVKGFESQTTLLMQLKQSFVKKEQYQQAKQVRQIQLMLQRAGKKIDELQQQKQKQVKLENFSAAKQLKQKISQVKSKVAELTRKFLSNQDSAKLVKSDVNITQKLQNLNISSKSSSAHFQDKALQSESSPLKDVKEITSEDEDDEGDKQINQSMVSHEERILPAVINRIRGMGQTQPIPQASEMADNQFFQGQVKNNLPAQPQVLGPADQANSSLLLQFYDAGFIRKLYSKYWQFRLQAVTKALEELKANQNAIFINKNRLRCYLFIYMVCLKIHNFKTTTAAFDLMGSLAQSKVQGQEHRQWTKQLHNELQAVVKATLQKAGDSNKKIKTQAQKTLVRMIQSKLIGISACYLGLIKGYPQKGASKLKKLRIQNLNYLVDKYGVGQGKVPLSIADFVFKAIADQQLEVRKAAVELVKSIKSNGGKQKIQILMGDSRISSSLPRKIQ